MLKKGLSLIISVLMLCALFSACGGGTANTGSNAPAAASSQAGQTTPEPEAPSSDELEFVTLTWYYPGTETEDKKMVEDALQEYLADKINCRVELKPIDWGAWGDQRNVMIASQEEFDIIFTAGWDNYLTNASKGAFVDITDMWDTYLPNTKALLPQAYIDGVMVNGRCYGVSTNKELAHTWGVIYRSDIASEVGADMSSVKSLADLGPVLAAVKEKHPDLIGIAMDKRDNTKTLLDWDPICGQEVPAKLYPNKDLTVVNEYATPETADLLKTVRDFYLKGYIRQDAATLEDRRPDYKDGKVFCYTSTMKPLVAQDLTNESGFEYEQLDFTAPFITSNDATGSINAISVTSKNPERALMFLELMNTDEYVNNLVNYGIEGVHYVKSGDNMRNFLEGQSRQTVKYYSGADWQLGNQFLNYILVGGNENKWDLYKDFNKLGVPSKAMGFVFDPEPVKTEVAAITNICNEYVPGLFTGSMDPDEYLPQFLKKLDDSGMQSLIGEAQKQLDSWAASK